MTPQVLCYSHYNRLVGSKRRRIRTGPRLSKELIEALAEVELRPAEPFGGFLIQDLHCPCAVCGKDERSHPFNINGYVCPEKHMGPVAQWESA